MRLVPAGTLALALLCAGGPAGAGEIIRFDAGSARHADVVLRHVPVKAVVAEFLDRGDSGLGKSIAYLLWRETLTAIGDQSGAGVILARAPGDQRITTMLERNYHTAAVRIAREQGAAMAIWGAVNAEGDTVYVSTYLTLLPEVAKLQLNLRFSERPGAPSGLETEIVRTKFNFPTVQTTRARLFERPIVTRRSTRVRLAASGHSRILQQVPVHKALDAVDMDKGWFRVRLGNGRFGYVENSQVDVPPRDVEASNLRTRLRGAPNGGSSRDMTLDGSYRVLDMRYLASHGLWYRIKAQGTVGWLPAYQVRPRFALPIVHFIAGLYRFRFKRYRDAEREFAQYVSSPEASADNASLATAYQLLGSSTLLAHPGLHGKASRAAQTSFAKAVATTPYDPTAYTFRALAKIALTKKSGAAIADLDHALRLDPDNRTAAALTTTLYKSLSSSKGNFLKWYLRDDRGATTNRLHQLMRAYPDAMRSVQKGTQ